MKNKIINLFSSFFFSTFLIFSSLFSGGHPSLAVQIKSESSGDNPLGIVVEQSSESTDNVNSNIQPDLGDDQAFPFIPGFGKNSGKD